MPPKKKKIEAKKTTVSLYNQIQKEFRVINDDSVEGVVEDPRGIRRK